MNVSDNFPARINKDQSNTEDETNPVSPDNLRVVNFEQIKKYFFVGMGICTVYSMLDEGIANALGLETLRHGDALTRYISGSLFGIDPATRSGLIGSCVTRNLLEEGVIKDCDIPSKGYFYVFKDSQFSDEFKLAPLLKLILPRRHATLSGISSWISTTVTQDDIISYWGRIALGSIDGAITPTMKFRYTLDNIQQFENDPDYSGAAYRTTEPISLAHTGIIGSLLQGVNSNLFDRIANRPCTAVTGVALIGLSILIAKKTYEYSKRAISVGHSAVKRDQNENSYLNDEQIFFTKKNITVSGLCWELTPNILRKPVQVAQSIMTPVYSIFKFFSTCCLPKSPKKSLVTSITVIGLIILNTL